MDIVHWRIKNEKEKEKKCVSKWPIQSRMSVHLLAMLADGLY